jgi:hypothetical protein
MPALLVCVGLLQQNSGDERRRCGEQPFDAPHLDRLKLRQVRGPVEEADADSSGDAAQADHEGNEWCGGQADPALDLMEVEVANPVREGNLVPRGCDGGCARPHTRDTPCNATRPSASHNRRVGIVGSITASSGGAAPAAGMAKAGADHELGATLGTGFSHFLSYRRKRGIREGGLRERDKHGRGPPKLLMRVLSYFSHRIGTLTSSMASRQPKLVASKVFSSQILANLVPH